MIQTPIQPAGHCSDPEVHETKLGQPEKPAYVVTETPAVNVVRTPYTRFAAYRKPEPRLFLEAEKDKWAAMHPSSESPKTPPSTIPETGSPLLKSPTSSRKKRFFEQNSSSQLLTEQESASPKRHRLEDSFYQWRREHTLSPSLRKRSPLKPVDNSNNSPNSKLRPVVNPPPLVQGGISWSPKHATIDSSNKPSRRPDDHKAVKNPVVDAESKQTVTSKPLQPTDTFSSSKAVKKRKAPTKFPSVLRAPSPEINEAEFTTHKVSLLSDASVNKKIVHKYKPVSISREIGTLERGYWRLPIPDDWSVDAQDNFHEYLKKLVTESRAGWGTWVEPVLVRDPVESVKIRKDEAWRHRAWAGNTATGPEAESRKEHEGKLELRVWCWGEVVREVWLALYLGGYRFMKGLGMSWVDGDGEAVVEME